jgi:hypothetical protein
MMMIQLRILILSRVLFNFFHTTIISAFYLRNLYACSDPNMHLSYSWAFHSALPIKEQPPQPSYMDEIL